MNYPEKQIDTGSGSGSGSGDNRRTYDCQICKRGFTNPQALGGHNNLHRRERGRYLSSSSSSSRSFPFSLPSPSQSPSPSINFTNLNNNNNPPPIFTAIESYPHQGSKPSINPSYNTQNFGSPSSSRGGGSFAQGEFHGLSLSLELGSMNVDDATRQSIPETQLQDDEIDLDLRLGCHRHH